MSCRIFFTASFSGRLGFEKKFIEEVCYLIKYHDTPITTIDINENYDITYKRYLIQFGDALAHNPNTLEKRKVYLEIIKDQLDQKILKY